MAEDESSPDFHSSKLGTQEYWDAAYSQELQAFQELGDVGEIWFGEEAQERMVRWLADKSELPPSSAIVDLGCGNGMLLLALRERGFSDLIGLDYSEGAIELSKKIAEKKQGETNITFKVCDLLSSKATENLFCGKRFDVCLDKGTYDAISLHNVEKPDDRLAYIHNVSSLLKEAGLLMITSCNWTREQLEKQFQEDFEFVHEIPAPKFKFGGKSGQTVTTLVLKRKN
ncbi:unnamed protein product [Lymnaea stagnalis]|uniref:Protein-lysine N-methyltransferase GSLYS_00008831001 n=1 Tax=Lymnaea stagnalis TaxID=6523 RepID=A0AAV2HLF7_LYMST